MAIGNKLGAAINRISNTYLVVQGNAIQVNILEGQSERDATVLCNVIADMKSNPAFCLRNGTRVVEYVAKDPALAIKTSYELGFVAKPKRVRYRVSARVATVERADYMALNDLFSQFLSMDSREEDQLGQRRISELSKGFHFGRTLTLREPGNPPRAVYSFHPRPQEKSAFRTPDTITYLFDGLPAAFGVPQVSLSADVSVDETGFTAATRKPDKSLISQTRWWPVDDTQVKALAGQIVSKASTQETKVQAILMWLTPGAKIEFGGPVAGSRWGVKNVLQQKYGRCWDFADCFVTLCRASGIPCREVAGWLYGTSGHVWAEVLIEGKGWQQVDATGGGRLKCGIYHIPYFTTENGEMPVLYVSMPKVEILESK